MHTVAASVVYFIAGTTGTEFLGPNQRVAGNKQQISSEGSSPCPYSTNPRSQLRHLGLAADPGLGCVTAPNSG